VAEGIADDKLVCWYFVGNVDAKLEKKTRTFYGR
jgi:hypothetical protein